MTDCVIKYPKGRCVLKDCNLGDPRVSKELERIAEGARQSLWSSHPVTVDFVDDASAEADEGRRPQVESVDKHEVIVRHEDGSRTRVFRLADEGAGAMIDPHFYSVLKQWGLPTEQLPDGKYKDETSQIAWEAYQCGRLGIYCEQLDDPAEAEQCPECGGDHPGEECIHVYLKRTASDAERQCPKCGATEGENHYPPCPTHTIVRVVENQCLSTSPEGDRCELESGHEGPHKGGQPRWRERVSERRGPCPGFEPDEHNDFCLNCGIGVDIHN